MTDANDSNDSNDGNDTNDTRDNDDSAASDRDAGARRSRRRRRRWLMFTGLPLLAIGGVFAAKAFADHGHGLGHHGHGFRGAKTVEDLRERMGDRAERLLGHLDATDAQRREVDAILDTTAPQLFAMKDERRKLHREMFDAVRSGDAVKIEAARKAGVTHLDEASKVWVEMAQLGYDVLDDDQKAEVMEHIERFGPRDHR